MYLISTYSAKHIASKAENHVMTASTDVGLLRKYKDRTTFDYVGPWEKGYVPSEQLVARQYIVDTQTNDFAIDVYDRSGDLNDLGIEYMLMMYTPKRSS